MAQDTTAVKKPGNPAFGKKAADFTGKWDPKKRYHFQLTETFESVKPRDRDTGEMLDNPYPSVYIALNEGVGINPNSKEIENWRYVFGYSTIWVKEQTKPEPSKTQLENPKNGIQFRNGSLFVNGNQSALLEALTIQDEFEGCENPVNPKPPKFGLINPEKQREAVRTKADMAYLAEKAAREASFEEMIPIAHYFGIDVDQPEEDEARIRTEFILKARQLPDAFNTQFTNPKNKYKYDITMALRAGIISSSTIPGKMVLVSTGAAVFDVREGDPAEQMAQMMMANNSDALKLYQQIERVVGS